MPFQRDGVLNPSLGANAPLIQGRVAKERYKYLTKKDLFTGLFRLLDNFIRLFNTNEYFNLEFWLQVSDCTYCKTYFTTIFLNAN